MTADEFLQKMLDDKEFLITVFRHLHGEFPKKKSDQCEALAKAANAMGHSFTAEQIAEAFSRLWMMKSIWTGTRLRMKLRRTCRGESHRTDTGRTKCVQ